MSNPLLQEMPEHGLPEFAAITPEHFREAIDQGFVEHEAEIAAIAGDSAEPDFANTVEALERSGALLHRVMSVFSNLVSSDTTEALQSLDLEVAPRAALHDSHIYTNAALFARLRTVREADIGLAEDQRQLLDNTYRHFLRAGAELNQQVRQRMEEIIGDLSRLNTQFSQNVLEDSNA